MQVYLVERYLVGWSAAEFRALATHLDSSVELLAEHGVRYVRSIILADDETCLCMFVGPDEQSIRSANVAAGLPLDRVAFGEALPS